MTGETLNLGWRGRLSGRLLVGIAVLSMLVGDRATGGQASSSTTGLVQVRGRVVNAITAAGIARALVNLGGRTVLTDAEGGFSFPDFQPRTAGAQAYVSVLKPGYAAALSPTESVIQEAVMNVSLPLELKLYPDGLISGKVTNARGQPLSKLPIIVFRETDDDSQTRMVPGATTMTNSHGEYRFEEPPGHYAVLLRYSPQADELGEVVLPYRYPDASESDGRAFFRLGPAEQRTIDIQAKTGTGVPVVLRAEQTGERTGNLRVQAQTGPGSSFQLNARPTQTPGEFRVELPPGTYTLHALRQTPERIMEAESRVSVLEHGTAAVTLRFSDVPVVPVQVIVDTSTSGSATGLQATEGTAVQSPNPQTLNLHLQKIGVPDDDEFSDARLTVSGGNRFAFEVAPGRYQLSSQGGGGWFVERASYGVTDLLTHPLAVSSGAGGEVIRLVVSSAMGRLSGTVRKSGQSVSGYVYLLPQEPTLTELFLARSELDGMFSQRLPPGSYAAVAFDHRYPGELRDAATRAEMVRVGVAVQVTAGGQASVDLEQQSVEGVK